MDPALWRQLTITYPGEGRELERHAVTHLSQVMPAAEADGLITGWWWIRKGAWRIRYRLPGGVDVDRLRPRLVGPYPCVDDMYEPEVHAFGGPASMGVAHTLWHLDCQHLLPYLAGNPGDRRSQSILLCSALMRGAGLDWNEQGDVWARIADQRAGLPNQPPPPTPQVWASFTGQVRKLMAGTPRADVVDPDWVAAFYTAGRNLRAVRESGQLTRGIRAILGEHVIFAWNRIGLDGLTQARLAHAAADAVFAAEPGR